MGTSQFMSFRWTNENLFGKRSFFDWCIGFLNCTGTSIKWQYVLIIIMKMGASQFAPFRWTIATRFEMHSSAFKMSDSKKQKATKLLQNFCCSACGKEMPRLSGLRCTSNSSHSATLPILDMYLIGRCNWNGKCYGKWCAHRIPVPKSREVPKFVNTVY